MIVAIWYMLSTGEPYHDLGGEHYPSTGIHQRRPGRPGHTGGHRRHIRGRRPSDQRCRQLPRLGRGRPLYAAAILTTRALPRWIGWLGLLVAALAGWLGLLSPASSVISGISSIGFIGFFVFMLSMGIALLRRRSKADEATQASPQAPT
jgi:hypothetical protein